jgi:hypothetical protein
MIVLKNFQASYWCQVLYSLCKYLYLIIKLFVSWKNRSCANFFHLDIHNFHILLFILKLIKLNLYNYVILSCERVINHNAQISKSLDVKH